MTLAKPLKMTADEFLEWAVEQPEGQRYELVDGEVVAMVPERARHNLVKAAAWETLKNAVLARQLACTVYTDGMTVIVDETTAYEPDVTVQCGPAVACDDMVAEAPTVLVEALSPGSKGVDTGKKLADYFRIPSVQHYLVLDPEKRLVIHYARRDDGIAATTLSDGALDLDPPGIEVAVSGLFPAP